MKWVASLIASAATALHVMKGGRGYAFAARTQQIEMRPSSSGQYPSELQVPGVWTCIVHTAESSELLIRPRSILHFHF